MIGWLTVPNGSNKMDFSEYDLVDDFELNEILWRSIKGAGCPLACGGADGHRQSGPRIRRSDRASGGVSRVSPLCWSQQGACYGFSDPDIRR